MSDLRYQGSYETFDTVSKKDGSILNGPDCIIGDTYTITFKFENDTTTAWLVNKFGAEVGYFDTKTSRELNLIQARGWTIRAFLSCVYFSESPVPGHFWGEAAIVSNAPSYDKEVSTFCEKISTDLKEGLKPKISLGSQAVDQMLAAGGNWKPKDHETRRKPDKGTVIMKSRMSSSEKAIEMGRKKNIGCYIISWIFIIAVILGIVFLVKGCAGL